MQWYFVGLRTVQNMLYTTWNKMYMLKYMPTCCDSLLWKYLLKLLSITFDIIVSGSGVISKVEKRFNADKFNYVNASEAPGVFWGENKYILI